MKTPKTITFGNIITDEQASQYFGFIYKITVNGRNYIGKKQLRCLKGKNKGKELDWRTYTSSSKEIQTLLKTHEGKFEILKFCETKMLLTYYEVYFQFKFDVLADDSYANENILGKFHRRRLNLKNNSNSQNI